MTSDLDVVAALRLPKAAAAQGYTSSADYALTDRARIAHPAVRWWWGIRRVGPSTDGARCYLCDVVVAEWDSHWPITAAALGAVALHRRGHVGREPFTLGPNTAGTLPPGEQRKESPE